LPFEATCCAAQSSETASSNNYVRSPEPLSAPAMSSRSTRRKARDATGDKSDTFDFKQVRNMSNPVTCLDYLLPSQPRLDLLCRECKTFLDSPKVEWSAKTDPNKWVELRETRAKMKSLRCEQAWVPEIEERSPENNVASKDKPKKNAPTQHRQQYCSDVKEFICKYRVVTEDVVAEVEASSAVAAPASPKVAPKKAPDEAPKEVTIEEEVPRRICEGWTSSKYFNLVRMSLAESITEAPEGGANDQMRLMSKLSLHSTFKKRLLVVGASLCVRHCVLIPVAVSGVSRSTKSEPTHTLHSVDIQYLAGRIINLVPMVEGK
jgi:hypothetical protein